MFAKVMRKASNMRLSNMASTAVGSGKFASDEVVRNGMMRQPPLRTNESSAEKLKSPNAGQAIPIKHGRKRKSAAGMSPLTSAQRRSNDLTDEERRIQHAKMVKVAKMKEDNDKLLRAYERGMINAKSPVTAGLAKQHRGQASSHKRSNIVAMSPSVDHEGAPQKLTGGGQDPAAMTAYYSTKKEWNKGSPYHQPPAPLKFSKDFESSMQRKQSIKALRREKSVAKVGANN